MTPSLEYIILGFSILLLLSILASKASSRLGVPALLLFLLIGMLAGSEGPGGIYFDDPSVAQSIGVVSLALILFSGGLDTNWQSVRPVLWYGIALSTVGVLITTFLVGLFATAILNLSFLEGLLLGAIVSSTDAAAVFGILRARGVGLKGYLTPLIELESGTNDPMAVFLTIGLISLLVNANVSVLDLVPAFVLQMALGTALGTIMGRGMVFVVNRMRLEYEGLYPVLSLSLVLLTYGMAMAIRGNGFLAVYLAGLVMGNDDFIHKNSLRRFHDGLAWLMQITMFLTLGLLVFPSRLVTVTGVGLLIAAFLILVARPASVFITLLFSRLNVREKALVSWVGLRGAVPIILATFPLLAGLPVANLFFNLVFFVVLTSVTLQGTTISLVARWLGVDAPVSPRSKPPLELVPVSDSIESELVELEIAPDSTVVGRQIVDLHLPHNALILLINRNNEFIVPRGGTILQAGDSLLVLADKEALARVQAIIYDQGPKI